MIIEKDIYRAAQLLVEKHQTAAEDYAIEMMHEFMHRDDAKEASFWLAIANSIWRLKQIRH